MSVDHPVSRGSVLLGGTGAAAAARFGPARPAAGTLGPARPAAGTLGPARPAAASPGGGRPHEVTSPEGVRWGDEPGPHPRATLLADRFDAGTYRRWLGQVAEDHPREDAVPRRPLPLGQDLRPKPGYRTPRDPLAHPPRRRPLWTVPA